MNDNLHLVFKLTEYDYQFLSGTWDGPMGAAAYVVSEDCMNSGLGSYGKPTEAGKRLMKEYEGKEKQIR